MESEERVLYVMRDGSIVDEFNISPNGLVPVYELSEYYEKEYSIDFEGMGISYTKGHEYSAVIANIDNVSFTYSEKASENTLIETY